jgi:hypothetical protein
MCDLVAWQTDNPKLGPWNNLATTVWTVNRTSLELDRITERVLNSATYGEQTTTYVLTKLDELISRLTAIRNDISVFEKSKGT